MFDREPGAVALRAPEMLECSLDDMGVEVEVSDWSGSNGMHAAFIKLDTDEFIRYYVPDLEMPGHQGYMDTSATELFTVFIRWKSCFLRSYRDF